MSFLSVLGKFAAPIAGIAAAPFTGGTSLLLPSLIGAGGAAASQLSGNMAHDRGTSAALTLDANKQFEDELMRRELEKRTSRNDANRSAIFNSMLAGYHPTAQRPAGMPASPFANGLGQIGTDAANFAAQGAFDRLKAGDTMPALQRPDISKFMHSSIWEKLLGLGGAGAQAYGSLAGRGGSGGGYDMSGTGG